MVVLLKFSSSKLNTSKATLFTWLNKSFLSITILTSGPGSKKHYPQQYLHDCVHCPWFWFGPIFFPYTTRAVFCSMDETLDIGLAPRFAISNSALKSNSLKKKILTTIETLFNSKWVWLCVCPIRNATACKFMEESAIKGLPSHYSIFPSQLKYQIKKI